MSGAAQNYKIVTQQSLVDMIITGVTFGVFVPRTVRVIK